jgi:hypothetical protein
VAEGDSTHGQAVEAHRDRRATDRHPSQTTPDSLVYAEVRWARVTTAIGGFIPLVSMLALRACGTLTPTSSGQAMILDTLVAFMTLVAAWGVLRFRLRTVFGPCGIKTIGYVGTSFVTWTDILGCRLTEKTVHLGRSGYLHGIEIRFYRAESDAGALVIFIPDGQPLSVDVVALLKSVPQLAQTQWQLLDVPRARPGRKPRRH